MIYTYNLTGDINSGESEKFNNFLLSVAEKEDADKSIRVVINSQGGSVVEGLALYDAIVSTTIPTRAEVLGICASAATYILCGADTATMSKNSSIMTHEPQAGLYGTVAEIAKDLQYFDTLRARVIAIYAAKTGLNADKVEQMLIKETTYLDAQEALNIGLVDDVEGMQREEADTDTEEALEVVEETEEEQQEAEEAPNTPTVFNRILTFTGLTHKLTENKAALLKVEAENSYREQVATLTSKVKELEALNMATEKELDGYKETLSRKAEQLKQKELDFNNKVALEVANKLSAMAIPVDELPAPQAVNKVNLTQVVKDKGLEYALSYLNNK